MFYQVTSLGCLAETNPCPNLILQYTLKLHNLADIFLKVTRIHLVFEVNKSEKYSIICLFI